MNYDDLKIECISERFLAAQLTDAICRIKSITRELTLCTKSTTREILKDNSDGSKCKHKRS